MVKQGLIDYLKCVKKNKAVGGGLLAATIPIASQSTANYFGVDLPPVVDILSAYVTFLGLGLFPLTGFGFETFYSYRKTKRHILEFGLEDNRYFNKQRKNYCNRVGMELALEEAKFGKKF